MTDQATGQKREQIVAVIYEDERLRQRGILLELAENNIKAIEPTANEEELLSLIDIYRPDIVFLDIYIWPDNRAGLRALDRIKQGYPKIPCVMITSKRDPLACLESMRKGAHGFVHTETDKGPIMTVINTVLQGGAYYNPQLVQEATSLGITGLTPHPDDDCPLTERELEIVAYMSQGMKNAQIADKIDRSENTVKQHKQNIFQALDLEGVDSRDKSELTVKIAMGKGWLRPGLIQD